MKRVLWFAFMFFALSTRFFATDIPKKIVYQGVLIESTGKPVEGNSLPISFEIVPTTGGSVIWTQSPTNIDVKGGLFVAILDFESNPMSLDQLNQPLTLHINVSGQPRGSVPFYAAMYALNVPDNAITNAKIKDDAVSTSKIQDIAITTQKIIDNAITTNLIAPKGVTVDKIKEGNPNDVLQTQNGAVVWAPMPPGVPVGTIIAYGGDLTQNVLKAALEKDGWFLCDGTKGTPNLTGMFLRGVQPGRSVLSPQPDEFKSHQHIIRRDNGTGLKVGYYQMCPNGGGGCGERFLMYNYTYNQDYTTDIQPSFAGGAETRPINVAVYYLMKVR